MKLRPTSFKRRCGMPRKATLVKESEEPIINNVLTSQDIKDKFSDSDYIKLAKQCNLVELKDCKQHWAIWLKDQSGDFHVLINDKSYKQFTYLGCYEGAKFEVVLEKSVFDIIKSYFSESKNETGNSINKFSTSSNTNLSSLQKV